MRCARPEGRNVAGPWSWCENSARQAGRSLWGMWGLTSCSAAIATATVAAAARAAGPSATACVTDTCMSHLYLYTHPPYCIHVQAGGCTNNLLLEPATEIPFFNICRYSKRLPSFAGRTLSDAPRLDSTPGQTLCKTTRTRTRTHPSSTLLHLSVSSLHQTPSRSPSKVPR